MHAYERQVYERQVYERQVYERQVYERQVYEMTYGRCTPMGDKSMRWSMGDARLQDTRL
jgi:hypothetical protein